MSIYDTLNDKQRMGVETTEGPVLLLAGAGSGKTRVLTHRIAYLLEEEGVSPWNILAITFTNKAAKEMRDRVDRLVGYGSEQIWVATFHATCVRILRRYADRLGYDNNFTIYDTDDQKSVMKDICKKLNIDTKMFKERAILGAISSAKDELISPMQYAMDAFGDFQKRKISEAYTEYQNTLKKNNAMDFDDLIVKTVELFKSCPEVLAQYQNRFRYIMVDEYQDTNTAQFELVRLLAEQYRNLCVVGDDDQSIYKFRGANIRNILDFEDTYPEATVIKLEQNYRSMGNILAAANAVISNNRGRKGKKLWTAESEGSRLHLRQFDTAQEEAAFIAEDIRSKNREGEASYGDCAVLYRTNAQARLLEERMVVLGIPYTVVGGQNFYGRKEIKDVLAYLKTIDNGRDDVAVKRIINIPKRGIGSTSIAKVQAYADAQEMSFYDALCRTEEIPGLGKAAAKIAPFVTLIQGFRSKVDYYGLEGLLKDLIQMTEYEEYLKENEEEPEDRIENVQELVNKVITYEAEHDQPTLGEFLEEVALVAEIDNVKDDVNRVLLMTLHSAKGLEFPHVYLAGMEDGVFPSYMNITSDNREDLEEERRLAYVGITRAMKDLTLTCAKSRMIHGQTQYNMMSRFVKEIPDELLDRSKPKPRFSEEEVISAYSHTFAQRPVYDYRPKAVPKPKETATAVKPFVSQGIGDLNKIVGISKGIGGAKSGLEYGVGDRVSHIKFGEGTVLSVQEDPRDYKVTVVFDKAGQKVMYASFAKLRKI
ncbi:MAG: DNA helicase PcrA [Lachnospiraceae bacterium]|nr:DNA helicase PcrA [Lachnospiraceae bacterium]